MSLNYVDKDIANQYQLGRNNDKPKDTESDDSNDDSNESDESTDEGGADNGNQPQG
jgi:hypothetical protein